MLRPCVEGMTYKNKINSQGFLAFTFHSALLFGGGESRSKPFPMSRFPRGQTTHCETNPPKSLWENVCPKINNGLNSP